MHTAEQLPFGPYPGGVPGGSCAVGEHKLMQGVDAVWSPSESIGKYSYKYGQIETIFYFHHLWTYLASKTHELATRRENLDKAVLGFVNPCPVKGILIFRNLAKQFPQFEFAASS